MLGRTAALLLVAVVGCSGEELVPDADAAAPQPAASAPAAATVEPDPAALLEEGRRAIEANCRTCYPATREGLLGGIELVRDALEAGYPDRARAQLLLANAYRTMAYAYERDPAVGTDWFSEYREAAAEAARLGPENSAALLIYVDSLAPEDQPPVLRRVLEIEPDNVDASFMLGMILIDAGDVDGATPYLLSVARNAMGLSGQHYPPAIQSAFRAAGREDLAQKVAQERAALTASH